VPDIVAVGKAGGSANITCDQNLFVLGDYAAGTPPLAGRPFGNGFAHLHKVFVPAWPFIFTHLYPLFMEINGVLMSFIGLVSAILMADTLFYGGFHCFSSRQTRHFKIIDIYCTLRSG
jgi:hypothetical protein